LEVKFRFRNLLAKHTIIRIPQKNLGKKQSQRRIASRQFIIVSDDEALDLSPVAATF